MTKKHDEKVAAEHEAQEHDAQKAKFDADEKRLKKAESKIAKISKAQAAKHILEGRD